jgi:hypothetical protein
MEPSSTESAHARNGVGRVLCFKMIEITIIFDYFSEIYLLINYY